MLFTHLLMVAPRQGVPYSTVRSRMLAGIDALRRHLLERGILEARDEGGDP